MNGFSRGDAAAVLLGMANKMFLNVVLILCYNNFELVSPVKNIPFKDGSF